MGLPLAGRLLPEEARARRPRRLRACQVLVRQLEGRPAGDRLEAADTALRRLGRGHDRRDVPRDAQRRARLVRRAELLADALVDGARVGLAAHLLHHLADEEPEEPLLAAAVLLGLFAVRR